MLLIASGAYIDNEFLAEFGKLPPAFLPVGNKRLYEYQVELFEGQNVELWISIPEDFELEEFDILYFNNHNVRIIRIPLGLSLGESIIYCWNSELCSASSLFLLHGDTLVRDADLSATDYVCAAKNEGIYTRAVFDKTTTNSTFKVETRVAYDGELVLAGLFSFSKPNDLVSQITKSNYDFIEGINKYSELNKIHIDLCSHWLDFGHVNTYHRSKALITTQRCFNDMKISERVVNKSSNNIAKMNGESAWFDNIPDQMKLFAPKTFGHFKNDNCAGYQLEYLYLSSLSDLFVFSKLSANVWLSIFKSIKNFIYQCETLCTIDSHSENFDYLYLPKTIERLSLFNETTYFDINTNLKVNGVILPSLIEMAEISSKYIRPHHQSFVSITHGDLCLSNILFDFRTRDIKVIDPRGIDGEGKSTIYGDKRYELAKLYHSVLGLYDLVIAKRFEVEKAADNVYNFKILHSQEYTKIQNAFIDVFLTHDVDEKELLAINVHLFLSMLPLHSDNKDRQLGLMLNACRMFSKLHN